MTDPLLPRIYVDFNTLNSEPIDLVKVGQTGVHDLPPLRAGQHVVLYDEELEVVATVQYDRAHDFWLAAPNWATCLPVADAHDEVSTSAE